MSPLSGNCRWGQDVVTEIRCDLKIMAGRYAVISDGTPVDMVLNALVQQDDITNLEVIGLAARSGVQLKSTLRSLMLLRPVKILGTCLQSETAKIIESADDALSRRPCPFERWNSCATPYLMAQRGH